MLIAAATALATSIVAFSLIIMSATGSFIPRATVLSPSFPVERVAFDAAADGYNIVCLDSGHGGPDLGAKRVDEGDAPTTDEADLNLQYAVDLASRLQDRGVRVVLTRRANVLVNATNADINGDGVIGKQGISTQLDDLQARINVCNTAHADLLMSMHISSSKNVDEEGYAVWYTGARPFGDKSRAFGQLLIDEIERQLTAIGYVATSRGLVDDSSSSDVGGEFEHMVMTGPSVPGRVVASEMPGAVVEPLMLSNDGDATVLTSDAGRAALVTAYERAILNYFGIPLP